MNSEFKYQLPSLSSVAWLPRYSPRRTTCKLLVRPEVRLFDYLTVRVFLYMANIFGVEALRGGDKVIMRAEYLA